MFQRRSRTTAAILTACRASGEIEAEVVLRRLPLLPRRLTTHERLRDWEIRTEPDPAAAGGAL